MKLAFGAPTGDATLIHAGLLVKRDDSVLPQQQMITLSLTHRQNFLALAHFLGLQLVRGK